MSQQERDDSTPRHLLGTSVAPIAADEGDPDFKDGAIAFFAKYVRGRKVLDVGCVNHNPENYKSRYWVHKAIRTVAASCLGMDLYGPGIAYLRERGYDVVGGNAEGFDLGQKFDAVVAGEIIEHLGNASGFLESVKRHLSPDGVLVISTPNPWYWRFLVKAGIFADVRPNREHVCWFCIATLQALLSRHGFEIIEHRRTSRYMRDLLMPLPTGYKHTTILVAAKVAIRDR